MANGSPDKRPNLGKVPYIPTRPIAELPDDHLLRALAYIAGSKKGLGDIHSRMLDMPPMATYAPILRKLDADTRNLHRTRRKADALRARELTDIALADLAAIVTRADRLTGGMRERINARQRARQTPAPPAFTS